MSKNSKLEVFAQLFAKKIADGNRDAHGRLKPSFIEKVMIPGSIEYISSLEKPGISWVIMTAGQLSTQLFKIELVKIILSEMAEINPEQVSYVIVDADDERSKLDMLSDSFDAYTDKIDPVRLSAVGQYSRISHHISIQAGYARALITDDKLVNVQSKRNPVERPVHPGIRTILVKKDDQPSAAGIHIADIGERIELELTA